MRADQERVKKLLVDTVTLLCKNGLFYQEELRVEGLLGVTLDNSDVFFVHISQKLMSGEEPRDDVLLPSDLTLAPTNSHGDMKDDAAEITSNNKMHVQECHDNRIVIRPMEERGQHSRSVSPSRYQQSSRSSIHSEDSNSMVDGQDLRRGTKRDQEEEEEAAMDSVKYLRRPDPSSRVPMPQDDSELVHPQAPGEAMHPTFSQFDQLIAAANQASSGETGGGKRRSYGAGEPGAHAPPPSGAFVTGIARTIHGDAANAQGPGGAGGGGGSGPNEWPNSTSAIEMAAHLAQSQNTGQLSVDTSALASTSSWPNTPISSAGQGPSMGQFGSADMLMYGSLGYLASAMEQHGKLTVSPAPQVAIVSEVVTPPPVVATVPNVSCPKPSAKKRRPKTHHQPAATGSSSNTKNRRSWLTKGKPYVCSYPGCRRSYFYQHDVKRHYKQQHSSGPEDHLLLGDRQTKT